MILLDAVPSNDEVMGFVIVFGLMLLCFVIAWLFGPGHRAPVVVESIEPRGPIGTVLTVLVILAIFYFVGRFLAIAHQ